jgi:alcohol dehydrogenase, propanol-preferring
MQKMRAVLFEGVGKPLRVAEIPIPRPDKGQVLLKVNACGLCHTDLHIVDGELSHPKLPLILGHQIVGTVVELGDPAGRFRPGDRVGVPWLGGTDGSCRYCLNGQENLCDNPTFTGYSVDGGFAEYVVANEDFCFPLPPDFSDTQVAPLLCAGLIGYRTYRMAGQHFETLGIYGFGAAAHIITQLAKFEGKKVFAFSRPGDIIAQEFALQKGANWAGDSTQAPPVKLDAALIFAPVGPLVVEALKSLNKGGVVVCGGIHMSDVPSFAYANLWEERVIRSVANLTRKDGMEFLSLAPKVPIKTDVTIFPLEKTSDAIDSLRGGNFTGAVVILIEK